MAALLLLMPLVCAAQGTNLGKNASSAFCLFELPAEATATTHRFINLGFVQYIELGREELRVAYGGGSLGGGHEARIPLKTKEEGVELIKRMQRLARECG